MLSRRLLFGGGGGSFAGPPPPFAVGPVGAFGWSDFSSQQYTAAYYNGYTYYGYLKSDGTLCLRAWNHATQTVSAETNMGMLEVDLHDVPSVIVRASDKRIIIYYNLHNGTDLYYRVSTNAEDISAMGAQQTLASQLGAGHYTYPQVHQLLDEASDPLYLFYRTESKGVGGKSASEWAFSSSTDGGSTWAADTVFWLQPSLGSYCTAWKTSETRIDVLASDASHGVDTSISIYHLYWEAGAWHKTDGTVISTPPFDSSDATRVYNGAGNNGATPNSIAMGLDGKPVAAFRVWNTYTSPEDLRYWWARWDGAAWQAQEIATNGANAIWGNITLDPADPARALVGRVAAGQTEMFLYSTPDGGATFASSQLTTSSTNTQTTPVPVRNAATDLRFMWGDDAGNWGTGAATPIGWG